MHKAKALPKAEFEHEVEKHLNGKDCEPSDLVYFKLYKSQIPIVEKALETAALMLGSDKSRGYCLEMICADFLAGAHSSEGDPNVLLDAVLHVYRLMPETQQLAFVQAVREFHSAEKPATLAS